MSVLYAVLLLEHWINVLLSVVLLVLAAYAFISAVRAAPQAYDVAFKRTKGFWLAMTGGSLLAALLSLMSAFGSNNTSLVLQLFAAVAAGVFLADVKPAVVPRRRS